jgi:predicted  nucleic acid-binding Zn-ribbon protein
MVPDRLSYTEMFIDTMKYPDVWTRDMQHYQENKQKIMDRIVDLMENYSKYLTEIQRQKKKLQTEFFHGKNLYEAIDESIIT